VRPYGVEIGAKSFEEVWFVSSSFALMNSLILSFERRRVFLEEGSVRTGQVASLLKKW